MMLCFTVNVFCGSANCYEILGVTRDAPIKDIKKAYRKLSLSHHPDKNKDKENATETFRLISKAYEVLNGNESRPLFDYYLDHPKVSTSILIMFIDDYYVKYPSTLNRITSKSPGSITIKIYPRAMCGW